MIFAPGRYHHANLVAELYHRARLRNIPCCLEYAVRVYRCRRLVVDVMIHSAGLCLAAIEVKPRKAYRNREKWKRTRQGRLYAALGLPVFMVCHSSEITDTLDTCQRLIDALPSDKA